MNQLHRLATRPRALRCATWPMKRACVDRSVLVLTSHQARLYNASAIIALGRSPTPTLRNECGMRAAGGHHYGPGTGLHRSSVHTTGMLRSIQAAVHSFRAEPRACDQWASPQYSQMLDRAQCTQGCICGSVNRWGEHEDIPRTGVRSRTGLDVWWHPLCRQPRSIPSHHHNVGAIEQRIARGGARAALAGWLAGDPDTYHRRPCVATLPNIAERRFVRTAGWVRQNA